MGLQSNVSPLMLVERDEGNVMLLFDEVWIHVYGIMITYYPR